MARWAVEARGARVRHACADFSVSETCYRYQRQLSDENVEIGDWLLRLDCGSTPCPAHGSPNG